MLWLTCNCFDLLNVHHMTADAEWVNCFHPTSAGIFDTLLSIHPLGLVWVQVLASIGVLCSETVMAQLPVMRVWCPILMTWCHLKNWLHWLWNPSKFFYSICTLIVCCFFSRSSIVDHRPFVGITNFALQSFYSAPSAQNVSPPSESTGSGVLKASARILKNSMLVSTFWSSRSFTRHLWTSSWLLARKSRSSLPRLYVGELSSSESLYSSFRECRAFCRFSKFALGK